MLDDNAVLTSKHAHSRHFGDPPALTEDNTMLASAETATGVASTQDIPHRSDATNGNGTNFGSAENDVAAEAAADIAEYDRINGADDFFGSTESRIRDKFIPAYKVFRRANCDPAYCAALAEKLREQSGGNYAPSARKPWCLAASLALKPQTERHAKQTYEAGYYFQHAAIEDVPLDAFASWIENRNLKASIAFVRGRKNRSSNAKAYPNIAKAKKLKKHAASAKILKDALDMAEDELEKLFANEPVESESNV